MSQVSDSPFSPTSQDSPLSDGVIEERRRARSRSPENRRRAPSPRIRRKTHTESDPSRVYIVLCDVKYGDVRGWAKRFHHAGYMSYDHMQPFRQAAEFMLHQDPGSRMVTQEKSNHVGRVAQAASQLMEQQYSEDIYYHHFFEWWKQLYLVKQRGIRNPQPIVIFNWPPFIMRHMSRQGCVIFRPPHSNAPVPRPEKPQFSMYAPARLW